VYQEGGRREEKKYGQLLNTTGQEINLFWGVDVCAEEKQMIYLFS